MVRWKIASSFFHLFNEMFHSDGLTPFVIMLNIYLLNYYAPPVTYARNHHSNHFDPTFLTQLSLTYLLNFLLINPHNFHLSLFAVRTTKQGGKAKRPSAHYYPNPAYPRPPPTIYHLSLPKVISMPNCKIMHHHALLGYPTRDSKL